MLKKWFGKKAESEILVSPVSGQLIKLEDVPDPVFSQKLMGEGVAIKPNNGSIVAPVSGEVVQLADTKHAFGIKTNSGAEVLVHIGLETVALKGEGFQTFARVGDTVNKGDKIIEADLDYIQKNASSTIIPIIITNSSEGFLALSLESPKVVTGGETTIITIKQK
ncbi:glucose PTS transporter subunit IIA [Niallia sp. NCCP-28]|uniref:PTS sugar transporter subunit IIA n=1 Tax=Niallia sp. NCCP-28 TaxID=2934712 RepID=UPI002088A312|nr:glucose PTS transporter subunit IIA [Niallia sp. NCCP-28]GKU83295.1 PTS glucose transporter subunit IIA [Niallia sp. NCCP-28]